jgi:hypothetical protein
MADKKISALTAATTPLAGTEVLPIVQGGSTVKVSVDDLTAGKLVNTGAIISGGTGKDRVVIEPQNAGSGALLISTNAAGNAYTPIAFDGAYTKFNVTGTEVARTSSNGIAPVAGKGIDFSANANAPGMTSELLTWYEEGNWTPVLTFGGGSTGITYGTQTGKYTRIGNRVLFELTIILTSKGSSSGGASISGLPFTVSSPVTGPMFMGNMSAIGTIPQVLINATNIDLYYQTSGANSQYTAGNFNNNTELRISGFYSV